MKKKTGITLLLFVMMPLFAFPGTAMAASTKKKALKAYSKFLEQQEKIQGTMIQDFAIVYLDNNSVPDLVTRAWYGKPRVYTYKKNKVTLVKASFANVYFSHYHKKKSLLISGADAVGKR